MADPFIGMTVRVKLKQPPSALSSIIGRVVNIHDQQLILDNVVFPETGQTVPSWAIPSFHIADLEVIDSSIRQPQPQYADPAILSFQKPNPGLTISTNNYSVPGPAILTPAKELPAEAVVAPVSATPSRTPSDFASAKTRKQAKATHQSGEPQSTVKKSKGWRQTPLLEETSQSIPAVDTPPSQSQPPPSGSTTQPTSVLETPLKQPKGKSAGTGKGKKQSRRAREEQQALQDGWATEVATDVQDMGDFDFEANLSKFDKKAVFDEIRNDDMTADEDRLVSHNRARPGTYGGKNLHPTEMVLSPQTKPTDDDADIQSDSYIPDVNLADGRVSRQSLQSRSRTKLSSGREGEREGGRYGEIEEDRDGEREGRRNGRQEGDRKGGQNGRRDGNREGGIEGRSFSGATDERSLSRALRNVPSHQRPLNASVLSSTSFNRSNSSLRNAQAHFDPQPHLRLQNGRHCPTTASERLNKLAENYGRRPGLSNESLVELTAQAIAQAICRSTARLQDPSRRNSRSSVAAGAGASTHDPKPVVVILAGNHTRGAHAIAAARHLYGRGYKLLVSCTDFSHPTCWHPLYSQQLGLLQSLGRKAFARLDSWPTISAQIKKLHSPPALIVDALLEGISYGAIDDVQKAIETREVIDWCNRSRAQVISIACPSGYDERSGETTVVEGEPVAVKPDRVLALGGVLQGVFDALVDGEKWSLSLLDIGLSSVMRNEEMVRFGGEWHVDLEFNNGD
ncbi:YjeF N-terminal domain-like protein [Myriangium duriaei CBS 260.36]|uniref:Enhancer of mRNA-decapping protein 3 n=1 Tax=Myriangium duriaei CBS 260.36 TaxID=1168546 RepID=A0A9P4MJ17_9PEZI|nr:YjeF N-terminal domain-like protein [Myriangium duriaei CBS 260.36]